MYLLAPVVSVEMLPPLEMELATFATSGVKIDKGLVTRDHLDPLYAAAWEGRAVPWRIASLSSFRPLLSFHVQRNRLDHTGRVMNKTKRGQSYTEFDMLEIKLLLPAVEDDTELLEASEPAQAGAVDDSAAPVPAPESFVKLFVRASPTIKLWPQPAPQKRRSKKAQVAENKAHGEASVRVCGKLFNGIPRGDAKDEAAVKADRDLPKDPEGLAFSVRATSCPGDPIIFGGSVSVAILFLVFLTVARRALRSFEQKSGILTDDLEGDFGKELGTIKAKISELTASTFSFLGSHKSTAPPDPRRDRKRR